tara:strand:- start:3137 stop:3658 length:522 start_codon:yes stop_codon:yes gene_type:complete
MESIIGNTKSEFSQQALDLQDTFCCNDTDKRKLIRWVGCSPGVYQGSKTLFSSGDLSMCSWFQVISDYNYATITLSPGEITSIPVDAKYLLLKAIYPDKSLESMKLLEIGVGEQAGYIGMTIPFNIENPTVTNWRYSVIKELFNMNNESPLKSSIKLNNISPYEVIVNIVYAK